MGSGVTGSVDMGLSLIVGDEASNRWLPAASLQLSAIGAMSGWGLISNADKARNAGKETVAVPRKGHYIRLMPI